MRLGLVVHSQRPRALEVARSVVTAARDAGLEVVARPADAQRLGLDEADLMEGDGVEVLVAVGGDGTVLEAVELALGSDLPVLGVNVGRMGFLAEVEPAEVGEAMAALAGGTWRETPRATVQVTVDGGDPVAGVNEVVVDKASSTRMVSLEVEMDGFRFVTYHADGVVVATPTGSSAYNYSAGGPLVDPELPALVLTAVAPHSLFTRPMVLSSKTRLRLRLADDRPAGVAVDGRRVDRLDPGGTVEVWGGDRAVRFVTIGRRSFPEVVAAKFGLDDA